VVNSGRGKGRFSDAWLLDSGFIYHMRLKEWFNTYERFRGTVLMGNDAACKTVRKGSIRMKMFDEHVRTLKDVRQVLDPRKNLLSLGALEAQGYKFSGADGVLKVTKGFMMVLKEERTMNLYKVITSVMIGDAFVATKDTSRLWYIRLEHMSERGLQALHNKGVLPDIKYCKLNPCKFCIMGRQSRVAFTTPMHKTKGLLDLVHTDVWGPSPVAPLGGACYYVTFIDDFS